MQRTLPIGFILVATSLFAAGADRVVSFEKTRLTDKFWAEGIAAGDFNRDGRMDVIYGPYWWAGSKFLERHEYRPASTTFKKKAADGSEQTVEGYEGGLGVNNAYSDHFFSWTHDFNQDGWIDVLHVGMPGEPGFWYENPRGRPGHWQRHTILGAVDNESPAWTDLVGDSRPELVCNHQGRFGYAAPDWSDSSRPWTWHPITPDHKYHRYTHGLGVGDVNGDGRKDLLEKASWWEQPASIEVDPEWKQHKFTFSPPTDEGIAVGGAQMFAYDVNGDGLNDVITAVAAHGYGLVWWEQVRNSDEVTFKRHIIIGKTPEDSRHGIAFSQLHAVEMADFDGDGLQDILTGKRFWAHGPTGDVDPGGPAVLFWFQLVRGANGSADFIPLKIDDDSGVGTQVGFADVNGDKRLDVITGNKKGASIFLQKPR